MWFYWFIKEIHSVDRLETVDHALVIYELLQRQNVKMHCGWKNCLEYYTSILFWNITFAEKALHNKNGRPIVNFSPTHLYSILLALKTAHFV